MLSMGVSKIHIIVQIIVEALMIAAVAILLSLLAAPEVSKLKANYLVEQQAQIVEEQDLLDEGKAAFSFEKSEQNVVGVRTEITLQMMVQDILSIIVLIGISVCVAGITIWNKNPKEILSKMS